MAVVERVLDFPVRIGGVGHSGWLPPGAAVPLPTPVTEVGLAIEAEEGDGGFVLVCKHEDGSPVGDSWHETISEARQQACSQFGVPIDAWRAAATEAARNSTEPR